MSAGQATIGARSRRKEHALELFAGLPRRYDGFGALLSFGQDPLWRARLVRTLDGTAPRRVLDVASGTGMVAAAIVRRRDSSVVALDQSEQMLDRARERLDHDPLLAERITLVAGEAERLPFADAEFDAVTFTYLLRYVDDPPAVLAEIARVVKPGGRVASLEFGVPSARAARFLWTVYTRLGLPLLGALVSSDWRRVGRFLGPSITNFWRRYPAAAQTAYWADAGIAAISVERLSFGAGVILSGTKRDDARGR